MRPEMPFLAAGGVAVVGATIHSGHLPTDPGRFIIGLVGCVIVASATAETKLAPLVHAFGMLVLLVTVIAATNSTIKKRSKA